MDERHDQPTVDIRGESCSSAGEERNSTALQPGQTIDHYRIESLLGRGGMGEVYAAIDLRLGRRVALKLLRRADEQMLARFSQEARIQARVDHPHICKIYEVGSSGGEYYIAMQFIAGKDLEGAAKEMSMEQKLKVMLEVCEAVHAAHREGLIHRDIKPANIMVERADTGDWKPYVTDFGLAREQTAATGLTESGMIVGTPDYMSPEQVRAEGHGQVDRRTDVFAIGVTLYELLSGRLPFAGRAITEVLWKVLQDDPPPLRRVVPSVPADLETIVMKALEKDPDRRYESARSLGEDLDRYLQGEPVLAKPASVLYRIGKHARKHRGVLAISACAAVLLIALSAMWLRAIWQTREQVRMANEFGGQVEWVDAWMRLARISPLHDLRADKQAVSRKMEAIRAMMQRLGAGARGPGEYALGRGCLALSDYEGASAHLQAAWQAGYREPAAAYALATVYGQMYRRQLEAAERIFEKGLREAVRSQAEQRYKVPAIAYLKMAKDPELSYLVRSTSALYEGHYDEALAGLSTGSRKAWSYEPYRLKGDVLCARARERMNQGNYDRAAEDLKQAQAAYEDAILIGRSDEQSYLSQCERSILMMKILSERGQDPAESLKAPLDECGRAITADPALAEGYSKTAAAYGVVAEYQIRSTGLDPRPACAEEIRWAGEALKRDARDIEALQDIGTAHIRTGLYVSSLGRDPLPDFQRGEQALLKIVEIDPANSLACVKLGESFMRMGEYETAHGKDPRPNLKQAIEWTRRAISVYPNLAEAHNAVGNAYLTIAEYEMGGAGDGKPELNAAIEAYLVARRINNTSIVISNNLGLAYTRMAEYELAKGIDPSAEVVKAVQAFEDARRINPNLMLIHTNMGLAYLVAAQYRSARSQDPGSAVELSVKASQEALRIAPDFFGAFTNIGIAYVQLARYQLSQGKAPGAALVQARSALQQSMRLNQEYYETYCWIGAAHLLAGRWKMKHGQSPNQDFRAAAAALNKARVLKPEDSTTASQLAELAQWTAGIPP